MVVGDTPFLRAGACSDSCVCPQGNGHERDFMGDRRVYIMDVYNRHIYPGDRFAKGKCHATSVPSVCLVGRAMPRHLLSLLFP